MNSTNPLKLLGDMSASQFLSEYWQKKPLLIRQAMPDFQGFLSPNDLAGLACEEEIQSRMVLNQGEQWLLEHGPFAESRFAELPETDWTLLVQSVDKHLPEGKALLRQFNFIPYARIDDLMVSYAPQGGSVGAHFDSYDVFLLQGQGSREWRINGQTDHRLVPDCDLRILENFTAEQSWILAPGDMLYLPPQYAHWGISRSDDCMTYSIGFRAPDYQSLGQSFLAYLQDKMAEAHITLAGRYQDPDLATTGHPAKIQADISKKVNDHLQKIPFNINEVKQFIGEHLTEPKADVFFEQDWPLNKQQFTEALISCTLRLDLQSQCLYDDRAIYMNSERLLLSAEIRPILCQFADEHGLDLLTNSGLQDSLNDATIDALYDWYSAGFCHFERADD